MLQDKTLGPAVLFLTANFATLPATLKCDRHGACQIFPLLEIIPILIMALSLSSRIDTRAVG